MHTLVGKFKRPSAQKPQNIDHDLRLLETIIATIERKRGQKKLEKGDRYLFRSHHAKPTAITVTAETPAT